MANPGYTKYDLFTSCPACDEEDGLSSLRWDGDIWLSVHCAHCGATWLIRPDENPFSALARHYPHQRFYYQRLSDRLTIEEESGQV